MYKYLFLLVIVFASCTSHNQSKNEYLLYIGTYTDAGSEGIYVSKFNSETGVIDKPTLATSITNPSFQYITSNGTQLWSVSEADNGTGLVCGYNLNKETGMLEKVSSFSTEGYGPCYVNMDEQHQMVLAANYGSGNVVGISTIEKGAVVQNTSAHQHEGTGPVVSRQEGPHAHSIKVGPKGKFVYSADLGTDKIFVYTVAKNELVPYSEISIAAGSGPRHFDFHPTQKAMAVINELNGTITLFKPDSVGCFSVYYSTTPTLPSDFTDFNKCADIHFSPNGKFLYASNRGHNSIAIYKIDQETMDLEILGWEKEMINWPRNFTISPNSRFLLVANKDANTVSVYSVDEKTGLLTYTGGSIEVSKPVCLNLIK